MQFQASGTHRERETETLVLEGLTYQLEKGQIKTWAVSRRRYTDTQARAGLYGGEFMISSQGVSEDTERSRPSLHVGRRQRQTLAKAVLGRKMPSPPPPVTSCHKGTGQQLQTHSGLSHLQPQHAGGGGRGSWPIRASEWNSEEGSGLGSWLRGWGTGSSCRGSRFNSQHLRGG